MTKLISPENIPASVVFTKESLQERAKEYMIRLYGNPGNGHNDCDKWMEKFGLLCGFVDDQFSLKKLSEEIFNSVDR